MSRALEHILPGLVAAALMAPACEKTQSSTTPTDATSSSGQAHRAAALDGLYFPDLGKKTAGELLSEKYMQWRESFVHDVEVDGETYTIVAMGPKDQPQNFEDGEGARVRWDVTTSEAIGYGLFALADAALDGRGDGQERAMFDKMWRFAQKNPSPASEPHEGVHLMAWLWDLESKNYNKWKADPEQARRFLGNASDGDIWMAAGLLRAHQKWGSDGDINYEHDAKALIELIKRYNIGPNSKLVTLGDWVAPDKEIQASSPGCEVTNPTKGEFVTRTSDFLWQFFEEFEAATGDATWHEVITATQKVTRDIQATTETKLVPDIVLVHGDEVRGADFDVFCDGTESGLHSFGWNAVRAPTWWLWHAIATHGTERGATSLEILRDMSGWMVSQGIDAPDEIGYEYDLATGQPKAKDFYPTIFITGFNAALMAEPDDSKPAHEAVDNLFLYLTRINLNEWYFDHTVLMLGLEPLSGFLSASK